MAVHVLTLVCPDRPGIVASISQGLVELDANILENAQFGDQPTGDVLHAHPLRDAGRRVRATSRTPSSPGRRPWVRPSGCGGRTSASGVLVMVSKYDHCLVDLLYRWRAGEMAIDIPLVVSNHPDLGDLVAGHGIAFEHLPVTPATKADADARLLELVEKDQDRPGRARPLHAGALARAVCRELAGRAINIHHSFLPGFKGAKPYHQAWQRGVKLIGATAHYVTADLDEGPIIDQDVARVSHAHTPDQMLIIGRDLERLVLSRAVKAHAEGRVFLLGRRTVVFS